MPSYVTGRMTWPSRGEAPLFWRGDYADIPDRVRRTGRLDTDQLWEDTESGDGHKAFWSRHGHTLFEGTWREQLAKDEAKNKARALKEYEGRARAIAQVEAKRVARLEAQRQRQLANQQAADAAWEQEEGERAAAIAWWSAIDPAYASEQYRPCRFGQPMTFRGIALEPNQGYWLPLSVRGTLLKELGW